MSPIIAPEIAPIIGTIYSLNTASWCVLEIGSVNIIRNPIPRIVQGIMGPQLQSIPEVAIPPKKTRYANRESENTSEGFSMRTADNGRNVINPTLIHSTRSNLVVFRLD